MRGCAGWESPETQLGIVLKDVWQKWSFPCGEMCTSSPAPAQWPIKESWRPVGVLWMLSFTEVCGVPAKFLKVRKIFRVLIADDQPYCPYII